MRVLVCGGRHFGQIKEERDLLRETLDGLIGVTAIIEGGAPGADRCARSWALANSVPLETFPAKWEVYGPAAGPIRNKQMVDEGKPDVVLAFHPAGRGTAHMVRYALDSGLRVFHVRLAGV